MRFGIPELHSVPVAHCAEKRMFGLEISGFGTVSAESEALDRTEIVGLSGFEKSYSHQLSDGMKQSAQSAQSAQSPSHWPTGLALFSWMNHSELWITRLALWRKIDISVVFITHEFDEAIYLADRILVMKANATGARYRSSSPAAKFIPPRIPRHQAAT